MRKKLGVFELGLHMVRLFAIHGTGGAFRLLPDDGGFPFIEVGIDRNDWPFVVGILMHEAMELSAHTMGFRFLPACDVSCDNGGYMFLMDHAQFSEATARAAEFVAPAIPALEKLWKEKHEGEKASDPERP